MPRLWPVKLSLHEQDFADGKVVVSKDCTVYVRLFLSESYVHCIGSNISANLDEIIWSVESLPKATPATNFEPSVFLRECLSARLAETYKLDFEAIDVRRPKKNGELQPPHLFYKNKKTSFDISLSHDGRFIAYAFSGA